MDDKTKFGETITLNLKDKVVFEDSLELEFSEVIFEDFEPIPDEPEPEGTIFELIARKSGAEKTIILHRIPEAFETDRKPTWEGYTFTLISYDNNKKIELKVDKSS